MKFESFQWDKLQCVWKRFKESDRDFCSREDWIRPFQTRREGEQKGGRQMGGRNANKEGAETAEGVDKQAAWSRLMSPTWNCMTEWGRWLTPFCWPESAHVSVTSLTQTASQMAFQWESPGKNRVTGGRGTRDVPRQRSKIITRAVNGFYGHRCRWP